MKKYNYIKIALGVLVIIAASMVSSCSSNEEDLLDNMIKLPNHLDLDYGVETEVLSLKLSKDETVFPAALFDISLVSENEKIVEVLDGGYVKAVGGGHTELYVYGKDKKLIRTISVDVAETHSYTIKVGEKVFINEIIGSDFKYLSQNGLFSSNPDVVYAGWEFSSSKYFIKGEAVGTAFVGSIGSYHGSAPFLIKVTVVAD